jgi:hypothetical protein
MSGPGSQLKSILNSLGIVVTAECPCAEHVRQMDEWGVNGCREHHAEIVQWLRDGVDSFGWSARFRAAAKAVQTGLAFEVNWFDPFPTLVTKAIDAAEADKTDFGRGCECPVRGFCSRHKRDMKARDVQICRGVNISETKRAEYIASWSPEKKPQSVQSLRSGVIHKGSPPVVGNCQYLGDVVRTVDLPTCCGGGTKTFDVRGCSLFGECQTRHAINGVRSCFSCERHSGRASNVGKVEFVYGVRTVQARIDDGTLKATLDSLAAAGFDKPWIFADGVDDVSVIRSMGLEVTNYSPALRAVGSFITSLWQLYVRFPHADRYIMFEDDVEAVRDLRTRLETMAWPGEAYLNLYTSRRNERLTDDGWQPALDRGFGSQGIVFDRAAIASLLTAPHLTKKVTSIGGRSPAWRNVDGMIWQCMTDAGFTEYVHWPSLLQHTGQQSTLGNNGAHRAKSFVDGEKGVTLITPTGDRPEAFALCERWMARQTFTGPIQWIVVDDGRVPTKCTAGQQYIRRQPGRNEGHTLSRNLRIAIPHIQHDRVLIIEDDEWYAPEYIERMNGWLDDDALVGCGLTTYYWPREGRYRIYTTHKHASLCRTGFRRDVLPQFIAACKSDHRSVDLRFWDLVKGRRHDLEQPLNVGMKQMPGRASGGGSSANDVRDHDFKMLRRWLGDDVEHYRQVMPKLIDPLRAVTEQIVVYTVVINGYDQIRRPLVVNPNVRYVAITDANNVPSPWEILRPNVTHLSPKHRSRQPKILGPDLFPEADWTIYHDGQLQLAVDPLDVLAECEAWGGDKPMYFFRHQERDCIYDEATALVRRHDDVASNVQHQLQRYNQEGHPAHWGLWLGGILIRRGHGACDEFNRAWWSEVSAGTHRDQLSLPVALRRTSAEFGALPANWWLQLFRWYQHSRHGSQERPQTLAIHK